MTQAMEARVAPPSATHLRMELTSPKAEQLKHSREDVDVAMTNERKERAKRRKKIHLAERLRKRTAAGERHELQTAHAQQITRG